jgi:hypothetical protein
MVAQPAGDAIRGAVGQQINRLPGFQVNQDGAIGMPFFERPIIDPQHPRCLGGGGHGCTDHAQQGIGTGREALLLGQARSGLPAQGQPDLPQPDGQSAGAPCRADGEVWQ